VSTLRDLQQQFADALFAGAAPAFADGGANDAARDWNLPARRIRELPERAPRTCPVVERLVRARFPPRRSMPYVRAHPSTCGDLNVYGDRFGPFLATYPPALELPYLPDVAPRMGDGRGAPRGGLPSTARRGPGGAFRRRP
jgi:hypothetical protein